MINEIQADSAWASDCFNGVKASVMKMAQTTGRVYQEHKVLIASVFTTLVIAGTATSTMGLPQEIAKCAASLSFLFLARRELKGIKKTHSKPALLAGVIFFGGGMMNSCISLCKLFTKLS